MTRLHARALRAIPVCFAFAVPFATFGTEAHAADPMTKEQCLDAHSRGQTLRDSGKVSQARELFLKCAQSGCPSLIQGDCARFADEMTRTVPSVSFVARDARGNDVVDTIVFVDDLQVADRLDKGKSFDVDPGEHTIKFLHGDKKVEQKVVVHQGERERLVVGTFPDLGVPDKGGIAPVPANEGDAAPKGDRSNPNLGPILLASAGGAALVTGGILAIVGLNKVPSQCSYWSKECSGVKGSEPFKDAESGAQLVNVGVIVGGIGLAALGGGLLWYFVGKPADATKNDRAGGISPWFDHRSGGVSWQGRF